MCVVDKTLFSNAGTVLGVYATHWAAVLAMLNEWDGWDEYENRVEAGDDAIS